MAHLCEFFEEFFEDFKTFRGIPIGELFPNFTFLAVFY
jgi:hypothetical protein